MTARRILLRGTEIGAALAAFALALTAVIILDQNRTKGRAWHR